MNKRQRKKLINKRIYRESNEVYNEIFNNMMLFGFAGLEMTEDGPRVLSYEEAEKRLQEIEEEELE